MVRTTRINVLVNGRWVKGLKVKVPEPRRRCVTKDGKETCWLERQVSIYLGKDFDCEYVVVLPYEALVSK